MAIIDHNSLNSLGIIETYFISTLRLILKIFGIFIHFCYINISTKSLVKKSLFKICLLKISLK